MGEEEDGKVVWNFDDAEAKLIFSMKLVFIGYRKVWDLENAYWSLLELISEIEPLFDETVQEDIKKDFAEITVKRKEKDKFSDLEDKDRGECFELLNDLYRKICLEMTNKDYYFRKKKEYLGL